MVTIKLELAENGVVKTIEDDNINGANAPFQSKKVYELSEDSTNSYINTINFIVELIDDLGLDIGNSYSPEMLTFDIDWGDKYKPSLEELKEKAKILKEETSTLKLRIKEKELEKDANS